jgi:hypothetical protein
MDILYISCIDKRRPLNYQGVRSPFEKTHNKDFIMPNLTQKPKTCTLTYFDGEFDALIGLSPQVMELDSPYYQGYLAASLEHDLVPF